MFENSQRGQLWIKIIISIMTCLFCLSFYILFFNLYKICSSPLNPWSSFKYTDIPFSNPFLQKPLISKNSYTLKFTEPQCCSTIFMNLSRCRFVSNYHCELKHRIVDVNTSQYQMNRPGNLFNRSGNWHLIALLANTVRYGEKQKHVWLSKLT